MNLADMHRAMGDETRLRILHLLLQGPLCVCHLQEILGASQVLVSKHLAHLRKHDLVMNRRHEKWMIYSLPDKRPPQLDWQLECLRRCAQGQSPFQEDLKSLRGIRSHCLWVRQVA